MATSSEAMAQLEAAAVSLQGRTISAIRYHDVISPDHNDWDHGVWHHAVMGVELVADDQAFSIVWDNTFGSWYAAELSASPMTRHVRTIGEPDGVYVWDVARHQRWASLIGEPISAVNVQWQVWQFIESDDPRHFPATTRLDFPGGSAWFMAAMPHSDDEPDSLFWPGDEIVVSFDRSFVEANGLPS